MRSTLLVLALGASMYACAGVPGRHAAPGPAGAEAVSLPAQLVVTESAIDGSGAGATYRVTVLNHAPSEVRVTVVPVFFTASGARLLPADDSTTARWPLTLGPEERTTLRGPVPFGAARRVELRGISVSSLPRPAGG